MNYSMFQSRTISLFLQHQRLTHRKILEQCKLSLQSGELIIECPNSLMTHAIWLRRSHIAKAASSLGIATIRFR